jgi:glycerophosphoryl diester phosphodiesterase
LAISPGRHPRTIAPPPRRIDPRPVTRRTGEVLWLALLCYGCEFHRDAAPAARRTNYWAATTRALSVSPAGNKVAVSCHNCYRSKRGSEQDNLRATLKRIHRAQRRGADIIELDVKQDGGEWYVDHDDRGDRDGPRLAQVLSDRDLRRGNQLLFLEIKERTPTQNGIAQLVSNLVSHGFAARGHEVVLRSFNAKLRNLELVQRALGSVELGPHAHYVRLQVLYARDEVASPEHARAQIRAAARGGYHGVEFPSDAPDLFRLLQDAREHGLGTNVWIPRRKTSLHDCARLRDVTDALTTDLSPERCRSAIEAPGT